MARIFTSGFEFTNTTDGGLWDSVSGTITNTANSAHGGLRGLDVIAVLGDSFVEKRFAASVNTSDWYVRFYVEPKVNMGVDQSLLAMLSDQGGINNIQILINTNRTLELWDGGVPAQLDGDSSALALDTYYRIEIKYIYSTKTATAYIDGVAFASGTTVSSYSLNQIDLGILSTVLGEIWLDDVAINDGTGAAQNGLPGDGQIWMLNPNAAGDFAEGSPVGAAFDWDTVDENPPDDATSYDILDVDGDRLDVNLTAATGILSAFPGATISVVHAGTRCRSATSTPGTCIYNVRLKSQTSGTLVTGPSITTAVISWRTNGSAVPRISWVTSYTDPQAGGAWTGALLDTAQIGIQATDALPDVWVTSLFLLFEFTVPAPTGVPWPHAFEHGAI